MMHYAILCRIMQYVAVLYNTMPYSVAFDTNLHMWNRLRYIIGFMFLVELLTLAGDRYDPGNPTTNFRDAAVIPLIGWLH